MYTSILSIKYFILSQRRGRSNPKTRSELFNPHKDEVASGFPIDPPKPTQALKEVIKDQMEHPPSRASYSGPLVPGVRWTNTGKKYDDISIVSARTNLSSLSGLVASRTSLTEESRDKFAPSHPEATDQVSRLPGSFDELGNSGKQDRKHQTRGITGSRHMDNLSASTNESVLVSFMTKLKLYGRKLY